MDAKGNPLPYASKDKAEYTNALHGAWADCHDTVEATAQRKADYAKQYDTATAPAWKRFLHIGKKKDQSQ